jgi:hypothetical protein
MLTPDANGRPTTSGQPTIADSAARIDQITGAQPAIPVAAEHLLKVAHSVARDASETWAQVWREFNSHGTSGTIPPEVRSGFVPGCGWPQFVEKLWLLKHYLDSIQRICAGSR